MPVNLGPVGLVVGIIDVVTKPILAAMRRAAVRRASRRYLAKPTIENAEALRKAEEKR